MIQLYSSTAYAVSPRRAIDRMAKISVSGRQTDLFSGTQSDYLAGSRPAPTSVCFSGLGKSCWEPVSKTFYQLFEEHQEWFPRQKLKLADYMEGRMNKLRTIVASLMMVLSTAIRLPDRLYNRIFKDYFLSPRKVVDLKFRKYPELGEKISIQAFQLRPGSPEVRMIHSFYLPARDNQPTIVFFHGRDCNLGHLEHVFKAAEKKGVGFFAIDYPGFGKSDGVPGAKGLGVKVLNEAGEAACRFLAGDGYRGGLKVPYEQQVLMGYSLGGGVATHVARQFEASLRDPAKKAFNVTNGRQPKGLILVNTFTSLKEAFADKLSLPRGLFGGMFAKFLAKCFDPKRIKYDFKSGEAVKNVSMPIRLFHCPYDQTIPYLNMNKLFDAVKAGICKDFRFYTDLDGQGHNLKERGMEDIFKKLSHENSSLLPMLEVTA